MATRRPESRVGVVVREPDEVEVVSRQNEAVVGERDSLRAALEDALEGLEEMIGYVDVYYRVLWEHDGYIQRAKYALGLEFDATNAVRLCDRCEGESGVSAGADAGDRACSVCGAHDAPHVYPADL